MKNPFYLPILTLQMLVLVVLVSCSEDDPVPRLSVTPTDIQLFAEVGSATPDTQYVELRVSNLDRQIYLGIFYSENALSNVTFRPTGNETGEVAIYPKSPETLGPGKYTDEIAVLVCTDPECNGQIPGSPQTINITYDVVPETSLSTSKSLISLNALEGQASTTESIAVTSNTNYMPDWSADVVYLSGDNWLSLTKSGNSFTVQAEPIRNGKYNAIIRISYAIGNRVAQTDVAVELNSTSILNATETTLEFVSIEGDLPSSQMVEMGFNTPATPMWTADVEYLGLSNWLEVTKNAAIIDVKPKLLPRGTHQAIVHIQYQLTDTVQSSLDIPVTYTVNQGVSFSQASVAINSYEGIGLSNIPLTINYAGSGNLSWNSTVSYQNGSDWLSISPVDGISLPATAAITAAPLPRGVYHATITVSYNIASYISDISIPVIYESSSAWSLPSEVNFTIDNTSTVDSLQKQVPISHIAMNWTASMSAPWIRLDNSTGDSINNNQLILSLVNTEVEKLLGNTHTSTLTLTSDNQNVAPINIPVNLSLMLPVVHYIMPYVEYEETIGNDYKVVRGSGFSGLQLNVMFGTQPATNVVVIGDSVLHVTPPILTAGTYDVNVENILGIQKTQAQLVVKSQPTFLTASIPTNVGVVQRVLYDEEREVVYGFQCHNCSFIPSGTLSTLFRFHYNNGWQMTSHSYPGLIDIAMTPDGKELLVLAGDLHFIDPVTMATNKTVNMFPATQMSVLNDGVVLFVNWTNNIGDPQPGSGYSLIDDSFVTTDDINLRYPTSPSRLDSVPDGSRAITGVATNDRSQPVRYYDPLTDKWTATSLYVYYNDSYYSTHANRQHIGINVLDKDFNVIGQQPTGFNRISGGMRQDGTMIYGFDVNTSQIQVADISGVPPFVQSTPIPILNPGFHRSAINLSGSHMFKVGADLFMVINLNQP